MRWVDKTTSLTDELLAAIYTGDGLGGDNTMRPKVIRELVDDRRSVRGELAAQ